MFSRQYFLTYRQAKMIRSIYIQCAIMNRSLQILVFAGYIIARNKEIWMETYARNWK